MRGTCTIVNGLDDSLYMETFSSRNTQEYSLSNMKAAWANELLSSTAQIVNILHVSNIWEIACAVFAAEF